jgi:hypothetical protein
MWSFIKICLICSRYKSAERKISQKNQNYMLNYSFPCSCSKNVSSFRFIIKQQWTIEEISIFSNISHLEWRAGLSDTILKGTHPRTIPTRFGLIWFRGFRGEDLNVKVYDVRTPSDGKSSRCLWQGEPKNFITVSCMEYISPPHHFKAKNIAGYLFFWKV